MTMFDSPGGRTMQTIQVRERTDKAGTLSLAIPLGQPDTDYDVVVVVQPKVTASGTSTSASHNRFAKMDAIRNALAATGRDFGDSVQDIREDRDR
jgi:hypothetical protein